MFNLIFNLIFHFAYKDEFLQPVIVSDLFHLTCFILLVTKLHLIQAGVSTVQCQQLGV